MAFPNSLLRFLSFSASRQPVASERTVQRIRESMLALLQSHQGERFHRVAQRVRYADELESLWYLRQDMLAALSDVHGERGARQHMAAVTRMFRGALPQSMAPRTHGQRYARG